MEVLKIGTLKNCLRMEIFKNYLRIEFFLKLNLKIRIWENYLRMEVLKIGTLKNCLRMKFLKIFENGIS